jgi:hypothetical protein
MSGISICAYVGKSWATVVVVVALLPRCEGEGGVVVIRRR